jgi:DNA-directed RNA polymerase I subunit RPA2
MSAAAAGSDLGSAGPGPSPRYTVDPRVAASDSHAPIQPSTLRLGDELARFDKLRSLVAPHIDSFNHAMGGGMDMLPEMIYPVTVRLNAEDQGAADEAKATIISVRYLRLAVVRPRFGDQSSRVVAADLLPNECRRAGVTYAGDLMAEIEVTVDGERIDVPMRRIARLPVMVGSDKCNLAGKSPADMVAAGEEQYELGGFFIINGSEKLLRMIVVPRSNAVISVRRPANMSRGPLYTDTSVSMRCLAKDWSHVTMHMHYLRTGGASVRIRVVKAEYFLPVGVVVRALLPSGVTVRAIFDRIVGGEVENEALRASALAVVTDLDDWSKKFTVSPAETAEVHVSMSQKAALAFIGRTFRIVLALDDDRTDIEAGSVLLRRYVLTHLSPGPFEGDDPLLDAAKVDMLVHMVRKLVAAGSDAIELDNADAPSHHELLLPGQLYHNYLKDRLEQYLLSLAVNIRRDMLKNRASCRAGTEVVLDCVQRGAARAAHKDLVTGHMNYMLATGNIKSESGLDLPQAAGYAIMAERINFLRFITHFRCVHRGAFYTTMRTTKVRKLLPEAWGFICPVQTPDGAPCGLLNHIASEVQVTTGAATNLRHFAELMFELGADPPPGLSALHPFSTANSLPIVCDGCVVGYVAEPAAERLATVVRQLKTQENVVTVPLTAEVVYIAPSTHRGVGLYPGIYVHTTACRMMRPVMWLQKQVKRKQRRDAPAEDVAGEDDSLAPQGTPELIGTLEQVFLQVRPAAADAVDTVTPVDVADATHAEIHAWSFMSEVAALTPFPDMNQGPRNIFQCQMAKQTMGTPCHKFDARFDSKVYRLTTPQVPITRNLCMQDPMGADLFPNGTNGIVAVLSYTGYDMEDALVLNQGSVNRGFCHGTVYANKRIDLDGTAAERTQQFGPLTQEHADGTAAVDTDGLPVVGARVRHGDHLCATTPLGATAAENAREPHKCRWTAHKSVETATVDQVQIVNGAAYGRDSNRKDTRTVRQATVRTRISRPPSVGDKFATRAGQKGTISAIWPAEDMPFSESGMTPDVIFNPNGFPSRMTIGMMVEQMAGKGGALHGVFHDSTPFRFDERCRAVDFFGEQLVKAGYNYYGNETLYSGYTGEPFKVDIFMGVIHYQRLRHMVSDKFQVRSTGKIHPLYRQPIQGRKRGGAIRFGEMERDGLLAHGASFLLRDRLGMASDMHVLHVCEKCGSLIAPIMEKPSASATASSARVDHGQAERGNIKCRTCDQTPDDEAAPAHATAAPGSTVHRVAIPYSFKYLAVELAAMNIRTRLDLRTSDDVGLNGAYAASAPRQ